MQKIVVKFKDQRPDFVLTERGRPGGSWTISVLYEGGFVIIADEWLKTVAFPADDLISVETTPTPSGY